MKFILNHLHSSDFIGPPRAHSRVGSGDTALAPEQTKEAERLLSDLGIGPARSTDYLNGDPIGIDCLPEEMGAPPYYRQAHAR